MPMRPISSRKKWMQIRVLTAQTTKPSSSRSQGAAAPAADRSRRPSTTAPPAPGMCSRQDDRATGRRNGRQEGQARGRLARQAQKQRRGDGDARARGAGNQRQHLGEADDEHAFEAELVLVAIAPPAQIGPAQQQAEDNQRGGHEPDRAQLFFGQTLEQKAEDNRRKRAND